MKKMIWITEAEVLNDYNLKLVFNDGSRKSYDFKSLIEKQDLYNPLKDKKLFESFKLDGWTVSWADGTIDIAPEFLYENGIPCFDEEITSKVAEDQAAYGK